MVFPSGLMATQFSVLLLPVLSAVMLLPLAVSHGVIVPSSKPPARRLPGPKAMQVTPEESPVRVALRARVAISHSVTVPYWPRVASVFRSGLAVSPYLVTLAWASVAMATPSPRRPAGWLAAGRVAYDDAPVRRSAPPARAKLPVPGGR